MQVQQRQKQILLEKNKLLESINKLRASGGN